MAAWRSAPSRPGDRFLRSEDGEIAGNVSAGCVEADLSERLSELLEGGSSGFVEYSVSDEQATAVGLQCGGGLRLHLSEWNPTGAAWPTLLQRRERRQPSVLITDGRDGCAGRRWLFGPGGERAAFDAAPVAQAGAADAADDPPEEAIATATALMSRSGRAEVSVVERPGGPVVVEWVPIPVRLVVVGANPPGDALCRLASAAGISAELVEPRPGYRSGAPVDGVVSPEWPAEALRRLMPDARTAVAVVAHDERIDIEALRELAGGEAGYVGLLGGRRTRERRFEALRQAGVSEEWISTVHAPIGLDIGAASAGEIGVAILAEVIAAMGGT